MHDDLLQSFVTLSLYCFKDLVNCKVEADPQGVAEGWRFNFPKLVKIVCKFFKHLPFFRRESNIDWLSLAHEASLYKKILNPNTFIKVMFMKKIGVVSGKGGVGKSTIAASIALALASKGFRAGLVDLDITCPNVPDILGKSELEITRDDRFTPSIARNVKYISIGQIASEGDPVLWDPKDLRSAARQLLERTDWGDLDYLVCDFPPGFEAETLELLPLMDCILVVTIPSALSKSKVERMVEAAREFQIPVLGVVKNMSYFECQSCGSRHRVFAEDHSFEELGIPTIAEFPLSPKFADEKCINEFPVEAFLEALKRPVLLKKKPKSLRRRLLELIFKVKR